MALTPHDLALIGRDPGLPGLALLLEPERLGARLEARFPGSGLARLSPTYLRYKPGTSCLAGFTAISDEGPIHLAAKAYKPRRYAVERARPVGPKLVSAIGPVALALDEAAVMVRIVPYDRDLAALRRLADPERRRRLLAKISPELARADWRVLRHKPGRRHIGLLMAAERPKAVVKLYAVDDFAPARRGAAFAARNGGADLLGSSARYRLLVSAWQPGPTLAAFDPNDERALTGMAAAGRAIARLHGQPIGDLPACSSADEAEAVRNAAAPLAWLQPELSPRAELLAERVAAMIPASDTRRASLHGDFSADQVVLGSDGVRLIDWDRAGIGAPARDLASFIARLETEALLAGRPRPVAAIDRFENAYAAEAGRLPQALDAWITAALLRLLQEPFRQRHADWPGLTTALLGLVEHRARAASVGIVRNLAIPA